MQKNKRSHPVLFLIGGVLLVVVAIVGYGLYPHREEPKPCASTSALPTCTQELRGMPAPPGRGIVVE
jgi:hypothetical protein